LAFKGDEFSAKRGGEVILKGTFKVDSSQKPKSIDMRIEEGHDEHQGLTSWGIYELEGDELTWCFDEPGSGKRPKAFVTEEGTSIQLVKLKRENRLADDLKKLQGTWVIESAEAGGKKVDQAVGGKMVFTEKEHSIRPEGVPEEEWPRG